MIIRQNRVWTFASHGNRMTYCTESISRVSMESDTGQIFFFWHEIKRLFWLIDVPRNRRATRRNEKSWPKPSPKMNTDEQTGWEYSGENDNYVDRKMTSPARKPHTVSVADIWNLLRVLHGWIPANSVQKKHGWFRIRHFAIDGGDGISPQVPKLRCPPPTSQSWKTYFFIFTDILTFVNTCLYLKLF